MREAEHRSWRYTKVCTLPNLLRTSEEGAKTFLCRAHFFDNSSLQHERHGNGGPARLSFKITTRRGGV